MLLRSFYLVLLLCFVQCERIKRVIGGIPVNYDMFPAAVYISREGQHICGGTRIQDIVLTAAHCVINSLPEKLLVQQRKYENGSSIILPVKQIISHNFNRRTNANDIAILYVGVEDIRHKSKVEFFPLPIKLPLKKYRAKGACFVSGPGVRNIYGDVEPDVGRLYAALMEVVPPWRCRNALGQYLAPPRNSGLFCAGTGIQDTCQGDSGSALLCLDTKHASWILAGIVSYGINCGVNGLPGVFTDVSYHINWINRHTYALRYKYL
ncbi:trypsin epsilon-like [Ctenocephalides felis]|uniref:trypsin epsilon-like n=1 Tax=Ctenocephalides felis TaxID=7515 RepID=UPI000E6E58EA|nr:trypsin epsilon-like [Ctenocephalides felis]